MRAVLFAMLVAATVAGLAGCGPEPAPAQSADTPTVTPSVTPTQTSPSTPATKPPPKPPAGTATSVPLSVGPSGVVVPGPGVTQVPADQVDARALPDYYDHHGEVWVFNDGYSLAMFAAASSGCSDAQAVVVDQSATEVKVMMRPLNHPPGARPDGGACTAVITPRPVTVTLREPLGDRTVHIGIGR